MTIRNQGRNLQDAVRMLTEADEYAPAQPVPVREAAETDAVRAAEDATDTVHRYIDGGGVSMDAALGAYATLALAASVDALRVAITDRLDLIADALSESEH